MQLNIKAKNASQKSVQFCKTNGNHTRQPSESMNKIHNYKVIEHSADIAADAYIS